METHHSYQNNGKSNDPTNQIPMNKIQQGLENQLQNQETIMNSWQPGHELKNGRFIIQRKLTWGGFADIYIAKDVEENQDVALKILKSELRGKGDFDSLEENFVKEAMNLRSCQHPHIVKFKDIIKTSEGWCMVMEYVEGEDLKSWVEKNGPLLEIDALRYICQIGKALIEVHNQRILHRDVKPRNIIRKVDGLEVVLIDFGIARKFSQDRTEQHTPYLTEDFAPIEQYEENYPRGACTDVYALAATLYFLLTGKTPIAPWRRLKNEPLETPQQIRGRQHISDKVNNAIILGMQIYPQERPDTVQKWLNLLPSALDEDEIEHFTEKQPLNNQSNTHPFDRTQPPDDNLTPANTKELSSLISVFTSPASFLVALTIFSSLGTTVISPGFWLVVVIFLILISSFITKERRIKQMIRLVVISLIPTLVIFLCVPNLIAGKLQGWMLILLIIVSSLLGLSVMFLARHGNKN